MDDEVGHRHSRAVEDFLRTVYTLQRTIVPVPTTTIAQVLHINASSVFDMIRRLSRRDATSEQSSDGDVPPTLLDHDPYHGVHLTAAGEQIALRIIRRRQLLELYLVQRLGYALEDVDVEGDRLEHDISERLAEHLAVALGNPEVDAYGEPIPTTEGKLCSCIDMPLVDMAIGQQGVVSRIADHSPKLLHYLADLGVQPGITLRVVGRSPLGDTVTVQTGLSGKTSVFGLEVAAYLRLKSEMGTVAVTTDDVVPGYEPGRN